VAVQNIEAEVAHLGLDDPEAPPLCAHHGPRVVAVLLLPPLLIPATAGHPWDLVTTALYTGPLPPQCANLSPQPSEL